jgi:hypothetical protein
MIEPLFSVIRDYAVNVSLTLENRQITYVPGESLFYYLFDDDEQRDEVFAWCADQFGPEDRATWMHDRDAVFISPTNLATAFRLRWC